MYDDAGRVLDFHALRATFASLLAASGCHQKAAQELMRHSTITLTMDTYTHTTRGALGSALAKPPDLSRSDAQTVGATGTDDAVSVLVATGARTGGNTVRNGGVSVREGAAEKARSRAADTTLSTRKDRELQRSEAHGEEQAAMGFEPVNDGFANRSGSSVTTLDTHACEFRWFNLVICLVTLGRIAPKACTLAHRAA